MIIKANIKTEQVSLENKLKIDSFIGNELYIINDYKDNLNVNQIKLGGNNCQINTLLKKGLNKIDLSCCNDELSNEIAEIIVFTENKILTKSFFISQNREVLFCTDLNITSPQTALIGEEITIFANYTSRNFPVSGVGINKHELSPIIWQSNDLDANDHSYSVGLVDYNLNGLKEEILFGTLNRVYIFNKTGTQISSISTTRQAPLSLNSYDLDNDGYYNHFVVASSSVDYHAGDLIIFNHLNQQVFRKNRIIPQTDNYYLIGDFNNNGIRNDVAVATSGRWGQPYDLSVYTPNGNISYSLFWNHQENAGGRLEGMYPITFGENMSEGIFTVSDYTRGRIYLGNGTILSIYQLPSYSSQSAVIDANRDGFSDSVLFFRDNWGQRRLSLFNFNLTQTYGNIYSETSANRIISPSFNMQKFMPIDFNGDGFENEFLFTIAGNTARFKVFNQNFQELFTVNLAPQTASQNINTLIKADIIGNTQEQFILSATREQSIIVMDLSGEVLYNIPIKRGSIGYTFNNLNEAIELIDINSDGINDIVFASRQGFLTALQTVSCNLILEDGTKTPMTWNQSINMWTSSLIFNETGTQTYHVNCEKNGYLSRNIIEQIQIN